MIAVERLSIFTAIRVDIHMPRNMVKDALCRLASAYEREQVLFVSRKSWHFALFAAFAIAHVYKQLALFVEVYICNGQGYQLKAAQATGSFKLDQRLPVGRLKVAIMCGNTTRARNSRARSSWKNHRSANV